MRSARAFTLGALGLFSASLAACGAAPETTVGLDEQVMETSEELSGSVVQTLTTGQAPNTRELQYDAANHICHLVKFGGDFRSGASAAVVVNDYGKWELRASPNVTLAARCINLGPDKHSTNFTWNAGQAATTMAPRFGDGLVANTTNSGCVLTVINGRFNDSRDGVRIWDDNGTWKLGGSSSSGQMHAESVCFERSPIPSAPLLEAAWVSGAGSATKMVRASGHTCYLTGVNGSFAGTGEYVESNDRLERGLYLGLSGSNQAPGRAAWAYCQ